VTKTASRWPAAATCRKQATYPELPRNAPQRLAVLGSEVGGRRWGLGRSIFAWKMKDDGPLFLADAKRCGEKKSLPSPLEQCYTATFGCFHSPTLVLNVLGSNYCHRLVLCHPFHVAATQFDVCSHEVLEYSSPSSNLFRRNAQETTSTGVAAVIRRHGRSGLAGGVSCSDKRSVLVPLTLRSPARCRSALEGPQRGKST